MTLHRMTLLILKHTLLDKLVVLFLNLSNFGLVTLAHYGVRTHFHDLQYKLGHAGLVHWHPILYVDAQ